ncbi:MAG: hypothetical protein ABIR69_09600 [Nitrospiraceae bacterium]
MKKLTRESVVPDHVGQRVLADLRNDHLLLAFFPEVGSNRSHVPAESPGQ